MRMLPFLRRALLLLGVVSPITPIPVQGQEAVERVDLCDLVTRPSDWSGRLVRTTGTVLIDRESHSLRASNSCGQALKAKGVVWPPALCLTSLRVGRESLGTPSLDLYIHIAQAAREMISAGVVTMEATFEGRIEARNNLAIHQSSSGISFGNGFCHLGQFPAVLHYQKVPAWKIEMKE